jgi:DNA-directed RNA polymerase II subunit RPB1
MQEGLMVLRKEVIPHGDNEVLLPVNLARLVAKAQTIFASQASQTVDVTLGPEQIITKVRELLKKLIVVPGKDELSQEAQRNATVLLFNHIRSTLASKRVRSTLALSNNSCS